MAVKALGQIVNPVSMDSDGNFTVLVNIAAAGQSASNVNAGTFSAGASALAVNTAILQAIKTYAENTWDVEFGLLDTARLVQGVDLLTL